MFNYGVFHFDQPNFYLNFTKGKLYYELGIKPFHRSIMHYLQNNRTIVEQFLNLSQNEKQQLFIMLMINAQPGNRDYYYNYCYDNCATRIRDMIDRLFGDQITYDYSYANDSLTYRELMDKYLGQQPWGDVGIDLCLGSEIDQAASGNAYMFMPEYLMKAFGSATIQRGDSLAPLIKKKSIINEGAPMPDASSPIKPLHISVAVFLLIGLATHRGMKYGASYKVIDYILFGATGLFSIALLLLWFATDHLSAWNLNVLWCTPLNLVAVYLLATRRADNILKTYFIAYAILLIGLIAFRELIPQQLHIAFVPLLLGLIIRSFFWVFQTGKK
jgi:hypothetical protein